MSIPQNAMSFTRSGKPYLLEIDEFAVEDRPGFPAPNGSRVGATRIIDISDEIKPAVVSNLRLEVIAACSMILSGLRIFDIRDPLKPREVLTSMHRCKRVCYRCLRPLVTRRCRVRPSRRNARRSGTPTLTAASMQCG